MPIAPSLEVDLLTTINTKLDALAVTTASSGTPVAGSLSATTTAAALSATSVPCKKVTVYPDPDNADDCFIGDATSQPVQIPGPTGLTFDVDNVNKLYGKMASGTGIIPWIAIT